MKLESLNPFSIWKRFQKYPGVRGKLRALHNKLFYEFPVLTRLFPRRNLNFEVQLVEHCNLNCIGCNHFSPVAEPEFLDIEDFTRDFRRLRKLFDNHVMDIRLMGGEPLLHPEINKFMTVARECFPESTTAIRIITNGLLLPQMPENFWTCCRENDIIIAPTKYPIPNFDYDKVEQLAHEHSVKYRYFGGDIVVKTMSKYPLDPEGKHDPVKEFKLCPLSNSCTNLRHGRLFTCPEIQTAHHLNKRFGTNFVETPEDSIDIYKAKSWREIMRFLAKPVPFCKYCAFEDWVDGIPWGQSTGQLSEWTV